MADTLNAAPTAPLTILRYQCGCLGIPADTPKPALTPGGAWSRALVLRACSNDRGDAEFCFSLREVRTDQAPEPFTAKGAETFVADFARYLGTAEAALDSLQNLRATLSFLDRQANREDV